MLAAAGLGAPDPGRPARWPFPVPSGIADPLRAAPAVLAAIGALERRASRPDVAAALLIDLPETNLPLGRRLRRLGVPVVQLVAPQTWAWRASRNLALRECCDALAVLLPFEVPYFRAFGVDARFVGHPLAEASGLPFATAPGSGPLRLALLPGSRPAVVRRTLPVMIEAARRPAPGSPVVEIAISAAPSAGAGLVERLVARSGPSPALRVEGRPPIEWLGRFHQAWVCAGTASLEVAWLGLPACVVFRTDPLSWLIARRLVRGRFGGLANRLLGREAQPELIQRDLSPDALVAAFDRLRRPGAFDAAAASAAAIRSMLGPPGFAHRAASLVEEVARSTRSRSRSCSDRQGNGSGSGCIRDSWG